MAIIRQKPNMFGGGTPTLSPIVSSQSLSIDPVKGCNIQGNYMYYGQYDGSSLSDTYYNIYRKDLTTGASSLFQATSNVDGQKKWSLVVNGLNGNIMYILLCNNWGSDVYSLNLSSKALTYLGQMYRSGSTTGASALYATYAKNKIFLITGNYVCYCYDLSTNTSSGALVGEVVKFVSDGGDYLYYITNDKALKKYNIDTTTEQTIFTFPSNINPGYSFSIGYNNNVIYLFFLSEGSGTNFKRCMYKFSLSTNTLKKLDNIDYKDYINGLDFSQAYIINKYAYFPLNAKYGKLR